jgi:hypothetical protein
MLRACLFSRIGLKSIGFWSSTSLANHGIETWNLIQFQWPEFVHRVGFQPIAIESLGIVSTPMPPDSITQYIALHRTAVPNSCRGGSRCHPRPDSSPMPPHHPQLRHAAIADLCRGCSRRRPQPDSSTTPLSLICPEGASRRNPIVF